MPAHFITRGTFSGNSLCDIRRDPFARATLMREAIRNANHVYRCSWCGADRPRLYCYAWESDGRTVSSLYPNTRYFCGISCWESFNS